MAVDIDDHVGRFGDSIGDLDLGLLAPLDDMRPVTDERRGRRDGVDGDRVLQRELSSVVERELRPVRAVPNAGAGPLELRVPRLDAPLAREGRDDVVVCVDDLERDQVRAAKAQIDRRRAVLRREIALDVQHCEGRFLELLALGRRKGDRGCREQRDHDRKRRPASHGRFRRWECARTYARYLDAGTKP